MPPNVKETASVIDSLATLHVSALVHSKFLPLTQHAQASRDEQVVSNDVKIRHDTTGKELRPTKEQLIADILTNEEHRQLFSIEHVQSNLVRDANLKLNDSTCIDVSKPFTQKEVDDYWDMATSTKRDIVAVAEQELNDIKEDETNDKAAKLNGDLYCLWHLEQEEKKRQDLIASIVEEERLRKMFSVNAIEASLIADATRRQHGSSCSGERGAIFHPETDSYWLWEMES